MKSVSRFISLILLLAIAILTGCIPQVNKERMVVSGSAGSNRHSGTVQVSVSGVEDHSWITPENLQGAIADSFIQAGLFNQVVTGSDADYHLDVLMVKLDQSNSIIGIGTTGIARMMWTLTRQQDHKQVFQDEIVTENTSHILFGGVRVKAAMGGCIQKNIQKAIELISKTQY